jgi:2-methylaconitate cis-trans-isomerase PrpF
MIILTILFLITACIYSSVGFGGGSTYLALLLLWGVPFTVFPVIALCCNIIVVLGNCINYIRVGNLNLRLITPYLIGSVPLAYVGGSGTGKLLPTGNVIDVVEIDGKKINISIVDAATPLVYIKSDDINLKCTENPDQLDTNLDAMKIIQTIRNKAAVMIGLARNENEVPLGTPRIGIVSEPRDYVALDKSKISKDSYDICTRMFSMGKAHKAIMGTAGVNIGVACAIDGTLPNLVKRKDANILETRVGNSSGIIISGAVVEKKENKFFAKSAVMYRTARPLMKGSVFI